MTPTRPTTGAALADIIAQVAPVMLAAVAASPEALAALKTIKAALAQPGVEREDAARLLSKGELAKRLSVSTSTVDRLCREGLPHTFLGDSKRFDVAACCSWLSSRGKRPTKAGDT